MKTARLAKLFEAKYGLVSEATSEREKFLAKVDLNKPVPVSLLEQDPEVIKQNIKDAYKTYILSPPKAYNILPLLANQNEPFVSKFIQALEVLVSSMDGIKLETFFARVNDILEMITSAKNDKEVRQNIHSIFSKPGDRETAKNKFEHVLYTKIASILYSAARSLKSLVASKAPLKGEPSEAERRQLSKQELWIFMKTPAAQRYGLDNMNVMEKILQFPDLRDKVTRLVNAINRGHIPTDGPGIAKETAEIIAAFKAKETNEGVFEDPEANLGNPQLEYSRRIKKEPAFEGPDSEYDPKFVAEQQKQEQQRLKLKDVADQDKKEKEQELLNKYNSLSFSDWLKRSSR